jgi:flagellar biogenesis protein FliO
MLTLPGMSSFSRFFRWLACAVLAAGTCAAQSAPEGADAPASLEEKSVPPAAMPVAGDESAAVVEPSEAVEPSAALAPSGDPDWLGKGSAGEERKTAPSTRGAALRSMGTLFVFVVALWVLQQWLRRRMATGAAGAPASSLEIRARLRLGVRQEVVVVRWGEDELVLGIGPTFIQRLHVRPGVAPVAEEAGSEEVGHAV